MDNILLNMMSHTFSGRIMRGNWIPLWQLLSGITMWGTGNFAWALGLGAVVATAEKATQGMGKIWTHAFSL
jgi:hypothetical protein